MKNNTTETDILEENRQSKQREENLKMMGYSKEEDDSLKSPYKETVEEDLPNISTGQINTPTAAPTSNKQESNTNTQDR